MIYSSLFLNDLLFIYFIVSFQNISDNKLGTAGAKCFCRMLSVNAGLRKLDLSGMACSHLTLINPEVRILLY